MRTIALRVCGSALAMACHDERTAAVEGPPLAVASSAATSISTSTAPAPPPGPPPIGARFADATAKPMLVPVGVCQEIFVTPVKGSARAGAEKLATGDVLAVMGEGGASAPDLAVSGDGVVLVATARILPCEGGMSAGGGGPKPGKARVRVVRATAASELAFMGGDMRAHLDLDDRDVAPSAYLGRLSGTASVPEHAHPGSWELLCALEASGTFTLAGQDQHLGVRSCVVVPPDTKHSWKPDAGSKLVAVQMYSPPGPEQRFKKLAADYAAQQGDAAAPKK